MQQLTARQQYQKAYRIERIYRYVRSVEQTTDEVIMARRWRADSMIGIRARIESRAVMSIEGRERVFTTLRAHITVAPTRLFYMDYHMTRRLYHFYSLAGRLPGRGNI